MAMPLVVAVYTHACASPAPLLSEVASTFVSPNRTGSVAEVAIAVAVGSVPNRTAARTGSEERGFITSPRSDTQAAMISLAAKGSTNGPVEVPSARAGCGATELAPRLVSATSDARYGLDRSLLKREDAGRYRMSRRS